MGMPTSLPLLRQPSEGLRTLQEIEVAQAGNQADGSDEAPKLSCLAGWDTLIFVEEKRHRRRSSYNC